MDKNGVPQTDRALSPVWRFLYIIRSTGMDWEDKLGVCDLIIVSLYRIISLSGQHCQPWLPPSQVTGGPNDRPEDLHHSTDKELRIKMV